MAGMTIKVHKANLGGDIKFALVARAIQLADAAGKPPGRPYVSEFVIPAGTSEVKRIECPPGYYRIEVMLPSGDILNQDAEVGTDTYAVVDLRSGGSPRDWLSWQTLAGVVPSKAVLESAVSTTVDWVKKVADTSGVELPSTEDMENSPALEAVANTIVGQFLEAADPRVSKLAGLVRDGAGARKVTWNDVTKAVDALSGQRSDGALLQQALEVDTSVDADLTWRQVDPFSEPESFWKRMGRSAAPILRSGRKVGGENEKRSEDSNFLLWRTKATGEGSTFNRWAVIRHDFGIEIARMPFPWVSTSSSSRPASIEILVDRRSTYRPVRTTVTVTDAEIGGLLSYMTAGTIAAGRRILHELIENDILENALQREETNPLAACAAGYAAIAIGDDGAFTKWHGWITSLMADFASIPDGAVIFAHRTMRVADGEPALDEAKKAFKEAFRRGLPFFAAGVQHLQDGLFTFRKRDPECERMYRLMLQVTARLDPGQPFTVLRYPKEAP